MKSLAQEIPLAISINDINFSVMLASPFHVEDFVYGYLHSESIIQSKLDIHDIDIKSCDELIHSHQINALTINIALANRRLSVFQARQRLLKGASGCGLCGTESLTMAFPALPAVEPKRLFNIGLTTELKAKLRSYQSNGSNTGALHGAFWISKEGEVVICREDIGRHNALDKVIGYLLQQNLKGTDELLNGALLVTSRCGAELVQKAVLLGVSTLISLASPSQLAVSLAKQANLSLIHIPKKDRPYFLVESQL